MEVVTQAEADAFLSGADSDKAALRRLFTAYISADKDTVASASTRLKARFSVLDSKVDLDSRDINLSELIPRLCDQYPGDVGIFAPFFLNLIRLKIGEGVFLPASEPHAYLSGDCLEAMACSDNVVRAGLTPKLIDKDTLCSMLTYKSGPVDVLQGETVDSNTRVYAPAVPEFAVNYTQLTASQNVSLQSVQSTSIVIVVKGSGSVRIRDDSKSGKQQQVFSPELQDPISLSLGDIFVLHGNHSLYITAGNEGVVLSRCYCPTGPTSNL